MKTLSNSKIIIEDNGDGMSLDIIENSWMNPATPNKLSIDGIEKITKKKRVIQGEKGIGRFAILKLGRKIKITTKTLNSNDEFVIDYDLSSYDDNFLKENNEEKELYIDDIGINVFSQKPEIFIEREIIVNHTVFKNSNNKGTRIEISDIKGFWNKSKVDNTYREISRLESIFDKIFHKDRLDKFEIGFSIDDKRESFSDQYIEKLELLFNNSSVLSITNGKYSERDQCFYFDLNNNPVKLSLNDSLVRGIK